MRANIEGADVVFHQAALRWTRCQENPRECQEVMVDGTFNVLEAAADAKVKRVVMASSAVVYGEPQHLPIHEDEPLTGTTIYTTVEPCVMCAGALVNARIKRLVFGAHDERFGAAETIYRLCDSERLNHRLEITPGVLGDECRKLMREFFQERRSRSVIP